MVAAAAAATRILALANVAVHLVHARVHFSLAMPGILRAWAVMTSPPTGSGMTRLVTLQMLVNLHAFFDPDPGLVQHAMAMSTFVDHSAFGNVCMFWYATYIASLTPSAIYYLAYLALMALFEYVPPLQALSHVCELCLVLSMYDEVAARGR
jgi:hypothetical protein